jgi:hypothetical protein
MNTETGRQAKKKNSPQAQIAYTESETVGGGDGERRERRRGGVAVLPC